MAQISQYRYGVELNFILDDQEINIPTQSISYIVVDYSYEKMNMPIIYTILNIESSLYNSIVVNRGVGSFMLNMTKYDSAATSPINIDYIKSQFTYFVNDDPNYTKDLDSSSNSVDSSYKRVTIGLLKMELINFNKTVFNGIMKNTNMASIVHRATSHMPMVVEPFTYNSDIATLIVPPLNSVAGLIDFLNNYSTFYDKGYRYFMDFTHTYLLSNSGEPIDARDGSYSVVSFNIVSTTTQTAQSVGMIKDDDQSSYIIDTDALSTNIKLNRVTEKTANHIVGISTTGEIVEVDLNINNSSDIQKTVFKRIPNNNTNLIKVIKDQAENTAVILEVRKTEIDASIITPNKEYIVSNFQDNEIYNGRYLLAYKKELYKQNNGEFISTTSIGLRRIPTT